MKKKILISLIIILLASVLFVPIPRLCNDGGTTDYTALTYRIIDWHRITDEAVYEARRVYFGLDVFKPIDELWQKEIGIIEIDDDNNIELSSFYGMVVDISGDNIIVAPLENEIEKNSSTLIVFSVSQYKEEIKNEIEVSNILKVYYTGEIKELYPAEIDMVKFETVEDLRYEEYEGDWLYKETAIESKKEDSADAVITEIYSNCFFAESTDGGRYRYKFNGELSDVWCVGDTVLVDYKDALISAGLHKIEAVFIDVNESNITNDPLVCRKPVIYLYPEIETEVSVKLHFEGELSCTYPEYNDGWNVTAFPDGTLTDENGLEYNYLYWEGITDTEWDMSRGFCIRGEDTAEFLEAALVKLGLNRREANEFIIYWLPLMQENEYNIISFQTGVYEHTAKLEITPSPDTLIRVFMAYTSSEEYVEIPMQVLSAPEREGFTVVEWGGAKIN